MENGSIYYHNHTWVEYGDYTVTVRAMDNSTESGSAELQILIDVLPIDDIITGYLIDEDSEETFDIFNNSETENQTRVGKENDTYLIDSDGDGTWDHTFNRRTGVSPYYQYLYNKYYEKFANDTPGFEIILLIGALAVVIMVMRRRKKQF